MNAFEELMKVRWIAKRSDRELYYRVKDELGSIRSFLVEKLGYRIVSNSSLIKVEKLPGEAQPWMGILQFKDPLDYTMFCFILMFLEDKDAEEQFVLSQLTQYLTSCDTEGRMAWTVYENRQRLIRVMRFCMEYELFLVDDGNTESFVTDLESEALYENTGLSKYFARAFTKDISSYQSVEDFFRSEWLDMNEDRGVVRRQRVYRKLLLSLGLYREKEQDEDFNYIRNYRSVIENDLEQLMDVSVQVFKSGAFLVLGENSELGRIFPGRNSMSDLILLWNAEIVSQVKEGRLTLDLQERIRLPLLRLKQIIRETRIKYNTGLAKQLRDMSDEKFTEALMTELISMDLIRIEEEYQEALLMPIVGRIIGSYPERYLELKEEEDVIE